MAELDAKNRARLPNSAFAYIDSKGRRRLPINDESHVRNALARFGRVSFEDDVARERARQRLLRAAKRYGIVPIGFFTGQLRSQRREIEGQVADTRRLPSGFVTFLLSDIEGSTALLNQLGSRYASLLADVRRIIRTSVRHAGGHEIDARADEFFGVFKAAPAALTAAIAINAALAARTWPDDVQVKVRIGLHSGRPTLTDTGYVGLSVHTAARVASIGSGGQILASGAARKALDGVEPDGVTFRILGRFRLHGLPEPELILQVVADGLATDFPPLRSAVPVDPAVTG